MTSSSTTTTPTATQTMTTAILAMACFLSYYRQTMTLHAKRTSFIPRQTGENLSSSRTY